jgi:hypothetical protein
MEGVMAASTVSVPAESINRLRESFPDKQICFEADFVVQDFWAGVRSILAEFAAIDAVPIHVKCTASGNVHCAVIDSGKDLQALAANIANRNDLEILRWTTRLTM